MGKVFLSFIYGCKKVNMCFVFPNLFNTENKSANKVLEMCFLWLKLDRGSWVHLSTLS
jgi:hypothetical protein